MSYQDAFTVVSHYFREANKPADRLANIGANLGEDVCEDLKKKIVIFIFYLISLNIFASILF